MVELTSTQSEALESMRKCFLKSESNGLILNDATYLRYLRARSYDYEKSSNMLKATIKWREEFGLNDLKVGWKDTIKLENSTGKMYVRGFSRDGHALLYMRPSLENTNDHHGNMKHLVYTMERIVAVSDALPTGNEKIVLLIDYGGFNLSAGPPLKTSRETLTILQDHYPERLHVAYCIRPPWIFNAFWTVISPFIDPKTKEKVQLLKNSNMSSKLLEKIDPSVLEKSIGGDDGRPFESAVYLKGEFSRDYAAILNEGSYGDK